MGGGVGVPGKQRSERKRRGNSRRKAEHGDAREAVVFLGRGERDGPREVPDREVRAW